VSLFSIIQAAGWPVWFLIVASFLAVALIIERWLSLQRRKVLPDHLLDDVLTLWRGRQATPEMVQKLEAGSPLGRVFATGLRHALEGRDIMKESMEETGRAVAHDLERYLGALGTLATVSPLLGLFGTVIGMIEIFGAQAPSGTNPQALAQGISIALYNTALGLVVAIPALIAYRSFRTRVDGYLVEMEQQSLRLVDTIDPRRAAAARPAASRSAAAAPAGAPSATAPSAPPQAAARVPASR
jgi:biopolymer transport protein ExbB